VAARDLDLVREQAGNLGDRIAERALPQPARAIVRIRDRPPRCRAPVAAHCTDLRTPCGQWDVSLDALTADLRAGSLPTFALVTPNTCHDMHGCPVATRDAWLRTTADMLGLPPLGADSTSTPMPGFSP
jgi:hypothetical protein